MFNSVENERWETSVRGWKTKIFCTAGALASSRRWRQGSQQHECLVAVCVDKAHCINKWRRLHPSTCDPAYISDTVRDSILAWKALPPKLSHSALLSFLDLLKLQFHNGQLLFRTSHSMLHPTMTFCTNLTRPSCSPVFQLLGVGKRVWDRDYGVEGLEHRVPCPNNQIRDIVVGLGYF